MLGHCGILYPTVVQERQGKREFYARPTQTDLCPPLSFLTAPTIQRLRKSNLEAASLISMFITHWIYPA